MVTPKRLLKDGVKAIVTTSARRVLKPVGWKALPAGEANWNARATEAIRGMASVLAAGVRKDMEAAGVQGGDGWAAELDEEIMFWIWQLGARIVEEGHPAVQRSFEAGAFQYAHLLGHMANQPWQVLDVGAGPRTVLGSQAAPGGPPLVVTAVDPLARAYRSILEFLALTPAVWTSFGVGEVLAQQFPGTTFHLVHARNSLDHARDPFLCIQQMWSLVRPGGWMVLEHADHEGRNQGYQGLHAWDFWFQDGAYRIADRSGKARLVSRETLDAAELRHDPFDWQGKPGSRVLAKRRP